LRWLFFVVGIGSKSSALLLLFCIRLLHWVRMLLQAIPWFILFVPCISSLLSSLFVLLLTCGSILPPSFGLLSFSF
jgi:phosphoglycerol transferase MdoB-like AlkP superfamily enzyme